MKKIIILTFMLLSTSMVFGQLALRGGINLSNVEIKGVNDIETSDKIGYHVGLQGHIPFGNILAIRPALLYNIKGSKVTENGADQTSSLHYLEAPIDLALRFGSEDLALIIEAGPYFGYLLNTSEGLFNNIGKTDWGVNFGAVIDFGSVALGANYSNSLSEIEESDQTNQAFKLKNGNLAVFIYFKF